MSESRLIAIDMRPINKTLPSTAFISAKNNADVRYWPRPGQANTVSISTVPSKKAINAVVEELVKQVAARSEKISVTRTGETVTVNGEIDVDALVMVVVGSMAGGP